MLFLNKVLLISSYSSEEGSRSQRRDQHDTSHAANTEKRQNDETDLLQNYVPLVAQMASCIIE